jgi:hypothetical protein
MIFQKFEDYHNCKSGITRGIDVDTTNNSFFLTIKLASTSDIIEQMSKQEQTETTSIIL